MIDPVSALTDVGVYFATGEAWLFANGRELTEAHAATPVSDPPTAVEKTAEPDLTEEPLPDNVISMKRRSRERNV